MKRKLIPFIIFLLAVIYLAMDLLGHPRQSPSALTNKQVPQFSLATLGNADKALTAGDFLGQVSLLNVWASWCVACRTEHHVLMSLARSGVVNMYGLNYKDQRADALRWLEFYGDPYAVSAYDHEGRVGIEFGINGIPKTFIIDKKGIIRYQHVGPVTNDVLNKSILTLIDRLKAEAL